MLCGISSKTDGLRAELEDRVLSVGMDEAAQASRIEPRWPPALAILGVLFLVSSLHPRLSLLPAWFPYIVTLAILVPIAAVALTSSKARWLRIERATTFLFVGVVEIGLLASLTRIVAEIVDHSEEITGLALLAASIVVWVVNVLAFSLLYWQIDRGGPPARVNNLSLKPDWLFSQMGVPEDVLPSWQPRYLDYLFLAYSTATAFSAADALPLTPRATMLMMLQGMISLTTIIIVASRAINIL
jgi:hypothetical protein